VGGKGGWDCVNLIEISHVYFLKTKNTSSSKKYPWGDIGVWGCMNKI